MPAVSVIIPCYNATRYVPEALESLRAQTFRDFETIVINDGCPDTENLERALEPYRDEIVYLKSGTWASAAGSRNRGIAASGARYIALLDADDLWEHDYLSTHVSILEGDPSLHLVHSNARYFGDPKWEGKTIVDPAVPESETTLRQVVLLERTVFVGVTARRESLLDAGSFDAAVLGGEDWDLWMRLMRNGGRLWYSGRCLCRYRIHHGMQSTQKLNSLKNHLGVYQKHLGLPGLSAEQRAWFDAGIRRMQADLDLFLGKQALYRGQRSEARERLTRANAVLGDRWISLAILGLQIAPRLLESYIHGKYPSEYVYLH